MDLQRRQNQRLQQQSSSSSQQHMVSHIQAPPARAQHMPRQWLPASGSLVEQQQELLLQSSNPQGQTTGNANGGYWREEVYQKIASLKDKCLAKLKDMLEKITAVLQQHEFLPHQESRSKKVEKLVSIKLKLERIVEFLCISKSNIQISHKEMLFAVENQILKILRSADQTRVLQHHSQPQAPQVYQVAPRGSQINSQMQPENQQDSMTTLQPNRSSGLQLKSVSSVPPVLSSKQNITGGVQPAASSLEKGRQINDLNRMQQMMPKHHPYQLLGHQTSNLHQIYDSADNDLKVKKQMAVKPAVSKQYHPNGQQAANNHHHQLKWRSHSPVSPPQVLQVQSPQVSPYPSPQIDTQNMLTSTAKAGKPLQAANSPLVAPSPSSPLDPSPIAGESENLNSGLSSNAGNMGHSEVATDKTAVQSIAIENPVISASPAPAECTSLDGTHVNASAVVSSQPNVVEQPIERLIRTVRSINSVVSMVDKIARSVPRNQSRAAVCKDQFSVTKCHQHDRNIFTEDEPAGTKRMRLSTSAMSSDAISYFSSEHDQMRKLNCPDSLELESTATSGIKRHIFGANDDLTEEIHEVNAQLIETVVEISGNDVDPTPAASAAEGVEGIIVKFCYSAVALNPNLKSLYGSAQMSPIQPLRLLIPASYPNSSPVLLDKLPAAGSKEYDNLSMKAMSKFSISLSTLSQPVSLSAMARTWDSCARAVVLEFAQESGGGTFSSKYGTWESC